MASLTCSSWVVDVAKCFGWIGDDSLTSFSQSPSLVTVFFFGGWAECWGSASKCSTSLPGCGGQALAPLAVVGGGLWSKGQPWDWFFVSCLFSRTGQDGHEWVKTKIFQFVFALLSHVPFSQFASVATPTLSALFHRLVLSTAISTHLC